MKKIKKILATILCVVMVLGSAPLAGFVGIELPEFNLFGTKAEAAETSGDYTYTVSDGEATITDVSTSIKGVVTIPATFDGYPVTSIGEYAFENCTRLTSVTIPDSVTSVGYGAFYECTGLLSVYYTGDIAGWCSIHFNSGSSNPMYYADNLNISEKKVKGNIIVPDGITSIGQYTFYNCAGITSITIPNSVTSIGNYAFYYCTGLTSVTIPNSVTSIGNYAFYYCTGLKSVTIPNNVTSVGYCAFSDCKGLTSVTIGNGVTSIDDYTFHWCDGLTSVTIGNGVTSIGDSAFSGCHGLTSVTIPDSVTSIGAYAFGGCNGLTSVKIPNSVTSIDTGAFRTCTGLTSVTIGNSVTRIGANAFESCDGLTSITIPDSVTSIGNHAFYYCTGLKSIIIPDSVTSIGKSAFYGCKGLTSVTIGNGVTSIGNGAFYKTGLYNDSSNWESNVLYIGSYLIKAKTTISGAYTIKPGTKTIAEETFYNCTGLTNITIPDSVTSIGYRAIYGCTGLTSVTVNENNQYYSSNDCVLFNKDKTQLIQYPVGNRRTEYIIPDSVTSIGDYAFYNCTGLKSVTIPDGVTSIGAHAFEYCTRLTSVTIPDSVTSMGAHAFNNCTGLSSVTIGNSVTSIGFKAFYKCTGLTSVTIPDSVTSIDSYAFEDCKELTSVYYTGDIAGWCAISFWDSYSNPMYHATSLYIDGKIVEGNIVIPNSVTSIGQYTFYNCTGLTSVTIPDSVTSIGKSAFLGCKGLTNVTISDSVTNIGSSAFSGCTGLTSVTIGNGVTSIGNYAFDGCTGLKSVYYTGDIAGWCSLSFSGYSPNPMEYADSLYIDGKIVEGNLVIPNSVTSIGDFAFSGCTGLKSVTIPDSVTSIGFSAFSGCTGLTSVTIGNGVTSIRSSAFNNTGLYNNSTNWKNSVLYIGNYLIDAKTTISGAYTIKSGTRIIADTAFSGCKGLTSVTIPDSVTRIESQAFYECAGLLSVYYTGDIAGWCSIGFDGFYSNPMCYADGLYISGKKIEGFLLIPDGVTSIGDFAFINCVTLNSVTIPDSVTSICRSAFSGCTGLTSVTIPDSVKIIGEKAFWNCTGLLTVYYKGDLDKWDIIVILEENDNLKKATFIFNKYDYKITWSISDNEKKTALLKNGEKIETPEIPEKKGYTFVGWTPEIPETMPAKDMSFTAVFKANSYDAVFNANGGAWSDGETTKTVSTAFDSEIIAPEAPTKQGYIFSKWSPEVGTMDDVNGKAFNAVWIEITYNRYAVETYTMNTEGEYVKTVQNYSGVTDSTANAEYTVAKGFSLNEEKSVLSGTILADNSLVLKVYFDRNKYTFTTVVDGAETETEYLYGSIIAEPAAPLKTGYTFAGWDKVIPATMPAEDFTVTARFTVNSYNAVFDANGGKWSGGATTKTVATDFGSNIVAPANPTRQGYDFAGWDSEIGKMDDVNGKTFSAKWTVRNDTKYTVEIYTMDAYGKYTSSKETKNGTTDTEVSVTANAQTGFTVNSTKSNLSGNITGDGSLVLRIYYDRNKYKLITNIDGNTTSKEYYYDASVSMPANPYKPGYKFIGWDKTIPSKMPANDVTVTAKFELSFTMSIRNPSTTTIKYGDKIILHADMNEALPSGWTIKWTADNGNFSYSVSADGSTCTISPSKSGSTNFKATVYDEKGNVFCEDTQSMTSKAGFFDKIGAFFRKLFGSTKTIPQLFKGIF